VPNKTVEGIHDGNKLVSRHSDNLFKPKIHPAPATSAALSATLSAPRALSTFLLFVVLLREQTPQPQPPPPSKKHQTREKEILLQTNERTNGVLVFWS
jgi:hypothetical protein